MKYYSLMRHISMATIPNCAVSQIVNFESRRYVEKIGRNAWGYFVTDEKLSRQQLEAFGIVDSGQAGKTILLAEKVSKFAFKVNDDLSLEDIMNSFIYSVLYMAATIRMLAAMSILRKMKFYRRK